MQTQTTTTDDIEFMEIALANKVLAIHTEACERMRVIDALDVHREIKQAAKAGIDRQEQRKIAHLMLDARLCEEPSMPSGLPQPALTGLWDAAMEGIAKQALAAASVSVLRPLMPHDVDI